MIEFLDALLTQSFLRNALIAALLASFGCGIVGSFAVVKRIGCLAGGIAHTILGGLGIAYYLGADPRAGAMVAAVAAALIIGWVSPRWKRHEDVIIVFISQTPGYNVDLMSYLFGNILMVSRADLYAWRGSTWSSPQWWRCSTSSCWPYASMRSSRASEA